MEDGIRIKVDFSCLAQEDRAIWKKLRSKDFSIDAVDLEYLKRLKKIDLVISSKTSDLSIRRTVNVSPDRCRRCDAKEDRYITNGTLCYEHLIEVLLTQQNIVLSWYPGHFMSGGGGDLLCGCVEDWSGCSGIGAMIWECRIHGWIWSYKEITSRTQ
jgi:hypothetical protein